MGAVIIMAGATMVDMAAMAGSDFTAMDQDWATAATDTGRAIPSGTTDRAITVLHFKRLNMSRPNTP